MRVEIGARTDVGLARELNEDAFLIWDLSSRAQFDPETDSGIYLGDSVLLLAVSDGMGGAQRGDLASQSTIETLQAYAHDGFADGMQLSSEFGEWFEQGVHEANRHVFEVTQDHQELHGMGATLSAATLDGSAISIAHVGDSRVYLCRSGRFHQLTLDHTHVQDLVAMGRIDPARARHHPQRHLLVRAIGTHESVEVERFSMPVCVGDALLICSDGLHSMVDDPAIFAVLEDDETAMAMCDRLVELANAAGGRDNVTVVIARLLMESPE